VVPILVQGLRRLEYRGYDSAGIAVAKKDQIVRVRTVGKVDNLANKVKLNSEELKDTHVGIAHTRWATHGSVTEANTHPHQALNGKLILVHNGIVENYRELKEFLGPDIQYASETDSEVLAHLIGKFYTGNLKQAVMQALQKVRGTYGIVVMHQDNAEELVAARMGSPLVVGFGDSEYYLASDATPMLSYTKKVMYLNDGEVVDIKKDSLEVFNLKDEQLEKNVEEVSWDDEQAEKQGFDHFMLKEIHDQPNVFQDAIRGRFNLNEGNAHLGGLNMTPTEMSSINHVVLLACGTASYAAQVGKGMFERLAGIPTSVEIASEFRYKDPIVDSKTLVFAISQSGETADTLAALREAKRKGAFVRGIVNVVGSTIARETDGGTYIHAGPELSVASTKAYTNMMAVLFLYALQFGRSRNLPLSAGQSLLHELRRIPEKMNYILNNKDIIKTLAEKFKNYQNCYFLGRGLNYPVALEGSLKLKEITYIHSEAYPGGEMKHGPIALLSPDFPVIAIMTQNQLYDKMRSNVEEIIARGAPIFLVATVGDDKARQLSEDIIFVPKTKRLLEPFINTVALQLFSYYVAIGLDRDVDRPRNLAKSVTVE